MPEEKDYHEILGVPKTATEEEIREAYRNLSLKYHPDKHTDNPLSGLAEERFKDVLEAYQALIVPQEKASDSAKAVAREGLILLGILMAATIGFLCSISMQRVTFTPAQELWKSWAFSFFIPLYGLYILLRFALWATKKLGEK